MPSNLNLTHIDTSINNTADLEPTTTLLCSYNPIPLEDRKGRLPVVNKVGDKYLVVFMDTPENKMNSIDNNILDNLDDSISSQHEEHIEINKRINPFIDDNICEEDEVEDDLEDDLEDINIDEGVKNEGLNGDIWCIFNCMCFKIIFRRNR